VTDVSFIVNHEHFKQDFACRRIAETEDISKWVDLQTHSNIVTALDSFKAKGPDGNVRHFSMTEIPAESSENMY
jgi:hypothetical protein